ncbi:MAG: DoxX family membrane protein [Microthrixaceae bacterium]|nr:DoxX family membrane protein [Microthrixaceae bacterium]
MTLGGVGYVTAVLLAVVFWNAGSGKLRDPSRVATEFEQMGIRSPETAAKVLPFVEFGTAVLLVAVPWVGAAVSLALLVGFTVILIRVVRSGAIVPCACFGASSTRPVSVVDLVRNGLLMVAAAVALAAVREAPSAPDIVAVLGAFAVAVVALRLARQARETDRA